MAALDVINLLSTGNLRSAAFASEAISSGFSMASAGVTASSNILDKITSSAADFKRTQIDQWYKSNQLMLENKSLEATASYRDASLKLEERKLNYYEQKAEEDRQFQREKLEESTKNKATFGAVTQKLSAMRSQETSLKAQAEIHNNTIKQLGERLKAPYLMSKSEYNTVKEQYDRSVNANNNILTQLSKLTTDFGNLEITRDALVNGFITPEDAEKTLGAPLIQKEDTKVPYYLQPNVPSGNVPITDKEIESFNPVNFEDDLWGLKDTLEATSKMSGMEGFDNPLLIRNFVDTKSSPDAKQYYANNRQQLERQYFESLFDDLILGEHSKNFQQNEERFRKRYASFGGTPEELDHLQQIGKEQYKSISAADNKVTAIKQLGDKIFNTKAESQIRTDQNGLMLPDGNLAFGIQKDKSGAYIIPALENEVNPELGERFKKQNKENKLIRKLYDETVDEKGNITAKAVSRLMGLSTSQLGVNVADLSVGQAAYSDPNFAHVFSEDEKSGKTIKQEEEKRKRDRIRDLVNNKKVDNILQIFFNLENK